MTTGNNDPAAGFTGLAARAQAAAVRRLASPPAGFSDLPDPAALAQLANEFFAALPGHSAPANGIGAPVPAVGPGAAPLPASASGLPGESELRGLPADRLGRPAREPALQTAVAVPTAPAVVPAPFYFLSAAQSVSPRAAASALNLRRRTADLEPLPVPGLAAPVAPGIPVSVGGPLAVPADRDAGTTTPDRPPGPQAGGAWPVSTTAADTLPYFLSESRSFADGQRALTSIEGTDLRAGTATGLAAAHPAFDAEAVRRDFPILQERVHGRPLIWLDNAATTQKPQAVIDRIAWFYQHENSNIHRAAHEMAARATDAYEAARDKVVRFLHASSSDEIVFVRGATEAINLVAQSWGRRHIGKDDEIVITWLEHHANIVPWQQLCAEKGARLRIAPVDDSGQILLDEYEKLLGPRTRLVAFTQVSNALGTVTPARQMIEIAHRYGARVLLDGAQAVSHMRVDVQALDCDWYVFSGHKVFGPTGIGVLYGKGDLLDAAPPWQGGGNMIQDVTFEKTVYQPAPARFEAGTGNIADAVGLGAALDYLEQVGIENVARYEHDLLVYAGRGFATVPGLRLIGTAAEKAGVLSFVLDGFRSEEVGEALNREGIAVRSGHHCAQPILRRFGLETTVRPSLALYNTCADIDALVTALLRIQSGRSTLRR